MVQKEEEHHKADHQDPYSLIQNNLAPRTSRVHRHLWKIQTARSRCMLLLLHDAMASYALLLVVHLAGNGQRIDMLDRKLVWNKLILRAVVGGMQVHTELSSP